MGGALFTIGYGGVSLHVFLAALREAGVHHVVDVRLTPQSKSAPPYCTLPLAAALVDAGIQYTHDPELGNPHQEACRQNKSLAPYRDHLDSHPHVLNRLLKLVTTQKGIALLCGCPQAHTCHRSVIAAALVRVIPGLRIQHLRPAMGEPREGPPPRIHGLTLWPEWAYAIAHFGKQVENRTWAPHLSVGAYLAIHGGKTVGGSGGLERQQEAAQEMIATARVAGIAFPEPFTLRMIKEAAAGKVVAVARFAGVVRDADRPSDPWYCGPVGWRLDGVTAIEPVPCRGAQKLWRLPEDVLEVVRQRYLAARAAR